MYVCICICVYSLDERPLFGCTGAPGWPCAADRVRIQLDRLHRRGLGLRGLRGEYRRGAFRGRRLPVLDDHLRPTGSRTPDSRRCVEGKCHTVPVVPLFLQTLGGKMAQVVQNGTCLYT